MKLTMHVNPERFKLAMDKLQHVRPFIKATRSEWIPITLRQEPGSAEITFENGAILVYKVVDFANWRS